MMYQFWPILSSIFFSFILIYVIEDGKNFHPRFKIGLIVLVHIATTRVVVTSQFIVKLRIFLVLVLNQEL